MLTDEEMRQAFESTNTSEPFADGWMGLERFGRAIEELVEKKNGINVPVETACLNDKPPVGIMPEKLWKESRVFDLIFSIGKYHTYNIHQKSVVNAKYFEIWLDELRRLLNDVLYK